MSTTWLCLYFIFELYVLSTLVIAAVEIPQVMFFIIIWDSNDNNNNNTNQTTILVKLASNLLKFHAVTLSPIKIVDVAGVKTWCV